MSATPAVTPYDVEPLVQLSRDIRAAARSLSVDEVRFLVQTYYVMQGERIRASHRVGQLTTREAPHSTLDWLLDQFGRLERNIKSTLDAYTEHHAVGAWAKSLVGIGPVLSAGLLAHIDIERAPTVGHIWRFAGLDPTVRWQAGQKRPWNAELKTLCWKIGESFVKTSSRAGSFYGPLYVARKQREIERNLAGEYAAQAAEILATKRFSADTDARVWLSGSLTTEAARQYYETPPEQRAGVAKKLAGEPGSGTPMLPPAHIHARARRWTVKLFLSHWHQVAYYARYQQMPPKPYVLAILGHADEIQVPNWPFGATRRSA